MVYIWEIRSEEDVFSILCWLLFLKGLSAIQIPFPPLFWASSEQLGALELLP